MVTSDDAGTGANAGNLQRDLVPRPDPTRLTTAALEREIEHLRELLTSQINDVARDFDGFMKNHEQKHVDAVDLAIQGITELFIEKLRGVADKFPPIQRQFDERDERTRLAFDAADKAVAAALAAQEKAVTAAMAAQEKAVAKSEIATAKQIELLQMQFDTSIKAIQGQLFDVKERIARDVGKGVGLGQAWVIGVAAITVVIGIASIIVAIVASQGGTP